MRNEGRLNYDAMTEFLMLGFVLGDDTFRKGEKVKRTIDVPEFETNRKSCVVDVEESLKDSIENVVKGKKNVAIHLSGGKDTRLIITLAHSLGIDFTAVTYGEKGSVDIKIAKKVAKELQVQHRIYEITPDTFSIENIYEVVKATDGLVSFTSLVGGYQLNKRLFPEFDVILAGSMMPEIMDTWDFKNYPENPLEAMKKRWGYLSIVKEDCRNYIDEKLSDIYDGKSLEEIKKEI